jgi:hypothetical protein
MNQLKQATIKKYSVLQLCKHLDRYQLQNDIFIYRFDFSYKAIYKIQKIYQPVGYTWNSFVFYCTIKDYNRDSILEVLNTIYSTNNF